MKTKSHSVSLKPLKVCFSRVKGIYNIFPPLQLEREKILLEEEREESKVFYDLIDGEMI